MKLFLALGALIISLPLGAQDLLVNVTANKIETDEEQSTTSTDSLQWDSLISVPGSMNRSLPNLTGVQFFNQGGLGRNTSVFVRGGNSEHTLVLIDGMEVHDPMSPNRSYDFSALSSQHIHKIELSRGPHSVLYGSDSLMGVLQIFTKKAQGNSKTVEMEVGAHGSSSLNTEWETLNKNQGLFLGLGYHKTDGYSAANHLDGNTEEDGASSVNVSSRWDREFGNRNKLMWTARWTSSKADIDRGGGTGNDDPNFIANTDKFVSNMIFKSFIFGQNTESQFKLGHSKTYRKSRNKPDAGSSQDKDEFFLGSLWKIELQNNYFLSEDSSLVYGVDVEEELGEAHNFEKARAHTTGFYGQWNYRPTSYSMNIGLRHDKYSLGFGDATTYRLGFSKKISSSGWKWRMSLASGFKTPSVYQVLDTTFGNKDLRPESLVGFDSGFDWKSVSSKSRASVNYFFNDFKDMFSYDPSTFKSINLLKVRTSGVEAQYKKRWLGGWNMGMSFSHLFEFENTDTKEILVRRSRNTAGVEWGKKWRDKYVLSLAGQYYGPRIDFDANTFARVTMPEFDVWRVQMEYLFNPNSTYSLRLENIFNERYEEVNGYGTEPFSIYLGARWGL